MPRFENYIIEVNFILKLQLVLVPHVKHCFLFELSMQTYRMEFLFPNSEFQNIEKIINHGN